VHRRKIITEKKEEREREKETRDFLVNIIDTCRLQPGSVFLGGYFLTPANRLNEKEDGRKEPLIIRSLTRSSVALVVVFTVWLTIGQMLPMKKKYQVFYRGRPESVPVHFG